MKKMNSSDTPLGTLDKQLKKQELLQTPYIILSGTGRDTGLASKFELSFHWFKNFLKNSFLFNVSHLVHQKGIPSISVHSLLYRYNNMPLS